MMHHSEMWQLCGCSASWEDEVQLECLAHGEEWEHFGTWMVSTWFWRMGMWGIRKVTFLKNLHKNGLMVCSNIVISMFEADHYYRTCTSFSYFHWKREKSVNEPMNVNVCSITNCSICTFSTGLVICSVVLKAPTIGIKRLHENLSIF